MAAKALAKKREALISVLPQTVAKEIVESHFYAWKDLRAITLKVRNFRSSHGAKFLGICLGAWIHYRKIELGIKRVRRTVMIDLIRDIFYRWTRFVKLKDYVLDERYKKRNKMTLASKKWAKNAFREMKRFVYMKNRIRSVNKVLSRMRKYHAFNLWLRRITSHSLIFARLNLLGSSANCIAMAKRLLSAPFKSNDAPRAIFVHEIMRNRRESKSLEDAELMQKKEMEKRKVEELMRDDAFVFGEQSDSETDREDAPTAAVGKEPESQSESELNDASSVEGATIKAVEGESGGLQVVAEEEDGDKEGSKDEQVAAAVTPKSSASLNAEFDAREGSEGEEDNVEDSERDDDYGDNDDDDDDDDEEEDDEGVDEDEQGNEEENKEERQDEDKDIMPAEEGAARPDGNNDELDTDQEEVDKREADKQHRQREQRTHKVENLKYKFEDGASIDSRTIDSAGTSVGVASPTMSASSPKSKRNKSPPYNVSPKVGTSPKETRLNSTPSARSPMRYSPQSVGSVTSQKPASLFARDRAAKVINISARNFLVRLRAHNAFVEQYEAVRAIEMWWFAIARAVYSATADEEYSFREFDACLKLQRFYRAQVAQILQERRESNASANMLQKTFRRHSVMKQRHNSIEMASTIQRRFR